MASHATVWYGVTSSSGTSISVGDAVVPNSDGQFVVATSANRALYGRARGVAKTAASGINASFEYQVAGILSDADSGVADGSAGDWVIVNATGQLERDATPDAGEDVIGRCPHTNGDVQVMPGVWDSDNSGASAFTAPTGTGFATVTAGALDAAATAFPATLAMGGTGATSLAAGLIQSNGTVLSSTATASAAQGGFGADISGSSGVPLFATGVATFTGTSGTGNFARVTSPTFVTPVLGAATATSLANATSLPILINSVTIGTFDANGITLSSGSFAITNGGHLRLWDSNNSHYAQLTCANTDLAAHRVVNVPLLTGDDTLVTEAHTQTLTNKTITSPSIGGTVSGGATYTSPTIAGTPVISATTMEATGNARCKVYSAISNVQTTDATTTTLYSWTIADEAHTLVTAEVVFCLDTAALGGAYIRRTRFERDGGTVATTAVEATYTNEDNDIEATIDNSTSTGRVRVTGLAATTYDWGGVTTRLEVNHA